MAKEKGLLGSSNLADDEPMEPTNNTNRAKMRRLPVDMPAQDLRAFGDQARDKGMTMRKYFYYLWDKQTGGKRSKALFDD